MVRSLAEGIAEVLNTFPSTSRITDTISPAIIIEGKSKMNFQRKMIVFGSYTLVYIGTSNSNKPRAVPAIALRIWNNSGGHYFTSLHTCKISHACEWEELPLDEHIIEIELRL